MSTASTNSVSHAPGTIVHARGREWIVLNGSKPGTLRVRPVSGTEEDQTLIRLALEREPVRECCRAASVMGRRAVWLMDII